MRGGLKPSGREAAVLRAPKEAERGRVALPHQDAERVDVGRFGLPLAQQRLGRHVAGGALKLGDVRPALWDLSRQAEIGDLEGRDSKRRAQL